MLDRPPQACLELGKLHLPPHQSRVPHPGMIVREREPAATQDSGFPGRDRAKALASVVAWMRFDRRIHDLLQRDRLRPGPPCWSPPRPWTW